MRNVAYNFLLCECGLNNFGFETKTRLIWRKNPRRPGKPGLLGKRGDSFKGLVLARLIVKIKTSEPEDPEVSQF